MTLLHLGGTRSDQNQVTFKGPGAIHNARWMAKALYTIKIALYRNQLQQTFSEEKLLEITSLALFLALFYTKAWLTCTNTSDSPINDLKLLKNFIKIEEMTKERRVIWRAEFPSFVVGARKKFENHLWYLSERLVPLSLFSNNLHVAEKQQLRKTMIKFENATPSAKQEMLQCSSFGTKKLRKNSKNLDYSFLKQPVATWEEIESYQKGKQVICNLPTVNDAAERVLGIATDTNTKTTPTSKEELQALYKVIRGV